MSYDTSYKSIVTVSPNGQTEVELKGERGSGSAIFEEPTGKVQFSNPEGAIQFFSNIIEKIKKAQ